MRTSNNTSPLWPKRNDEHPDRAHHVAEERRQVQRAEEAPWVDPVELIGEGNPHELEIVARSGRVRARFYHSGRWWQWKEVTPREAIRIGSDGRSLVDSEHWVLRVNADDWHEYIDQQRPAEPSPQPVAAATPAPSPASTEPAPPPAAKKRATVRAQPSTYANHVTEHLERAGEYPSETDDKKWAGENGYIQTHVTKVLRRKYRNGLEKSERDRFEDAAKGKH
jgi:hypothetical protein